MQLFRLIRREAALGPKSPALMIEEAFADMVDINTLIRRTLDPFIQGMIEGNAAEGIDARAAAHGIARNCEKHLIKGVEEVLGLGGSLLRGPQKKLYVKTADFNLGLRHITDHACASFDFYYGDLPSVDERVAVGDCMERVAARFTSEARNPPLFAGDVSKLRKWRPSIFHGFYDMIFPY